MHRRTSPKPRHARPLGRKANPTPDLLQRRDELGPTFNAASLLRLQRTIGNRATVAMLQRQDEEGSITVASSTSAEETAPDTESYTRGLTGELEQDETPTDEELNQALEERAAGVKFTSTHPSIAQVGIRPTEIKGKKLGVYIGNENYKGEGIGSLPGAARDAENMKSTMEGRGYKTLAEYKDQTAPGIDAVLKTSIPWAGEGDALLLYYAGHGIPDGMVGVNAEVEEETESTGDRGVKMTEASPEELTAENVTDVEHYSKAMAALERGVAAGVHTTLIADACFTGAATDLVRAKAVEKLAEGASSERITAVTEQIARLEDMKAQIETGASAPTETQSDGEEGTDRGLVLKSNLELKSVTQEYWEEIVRPELEVVSQYLKEGGMDVQIPETLADYSKASIEQQINQVINKLIDLGEQIKEEEKASTVQKAPG